MSGKTTPAPFDLTKMMMPAFSNWAFAEREDRLEEKTFEGIQHAQRAVWEQAEKALDAEHAKEAGTGIHLASEASEATPLLLPAGAGLKVYTSATIV